jgi:membrane-associated phospholipid phosphatase
MNMTSFDDLKAKPEYPLAGISSAAALAFGVLASRTLKPRTILEDLRLRAHLPRYSRRAKKIAIPFGHLGKEMAVLPIAGLTGAKLLAENKKAAAAAVISATLAAVGSSHLFDALLQQRTPPPGRRAPADPHFPSGHALHSTALLGIGAWVLSREGMISRKTAAISAATLAVALGFDRLVQDRHWTSDVVAGWLAAISIAGLAAGAYETARPRAVRRRAAAARRRGNR